MTAGLLWLFPGAEFFREDRKRAGFKPSELIAIRLDAQVLGWL